MTIHTKIELISQFQITPDELKFLIQLNLPINYDEFVKHNNYELLLARIEEIIDNRKLGEENLLNLVYIKSKLKKEIIKFSEIDEEYDFIDIEEDPEVIEFDKELEYNWKERRRTQKEAIAKYQNYSQKEIDSLLFEYVWTKYPQIRNGFDRSVYSKARYTFTSHIGIYATIEAPESLRVKLNNAEQNVKYLIIENFKKLENRKFEEWLTEYRKWLSKSEITKSTKTNIKEFFKEKGIKATDTTISKIKSNF